MEEFFQPLKSVKAPSAGFSIRINVRYNDDIKYLETKFCTTYVKIRTRLGDFLQVHSIVLCLLRVNRQYFLDDPGIIDRNYACFQ